MPAPLAPEFLEFLRQELLDILNLSCTHMPREDLQDHIDGIIHRLYGIAYGQQFVVLFVAALGVVTALLISVLQRRREMGLLRAVGGSRWHVIRCVLAEAALMGVIGSVIGFLVGIPLEWFALQIVILEESGYLFPLVIPWQEALLISGAAVLVATLARLGPSLYAVRQRIPEAIADGDECLQQCERHDRPGCLQPRDRRGR